MELQPLAQHQTHTYQAKQGPEPGQQNNNRKIELTPAQDTKTGLQFLQDRRDVKVLTQSAKFKRMPDHPMKEKRKMKSQFINLAFFRRAAHWKI